MTGLEELKAVNQEQWYRERFFSSCHERGTKGIEPQTFGFRAPMLYHLATTERGPDYEFHMTRVLHNAGISNVDSVMFI